MYGGVSTYITGVLGILMFAAGGSTYAAGTTGILTYATSSMYATGPQRISMSARAPGIMIHATGKLGILILVDILKHVLYIKEMQLVVM